MGLYLSVESAIAERFENYAQVQAGRPPTNTVQDLPRKGQFDIPIHIPAMVHGMRTSIPVFRVDKDGHDASIWPAITYGIDDEEDRPGNWLHKSNTNEICRPVGRAFQHNTRTGEERSGADLIQAYPYPDPVTLTYEIRTWSLNYDESNQLKEIVKSVFPSRGFLSIRLNNGDIVTRDMLRADGPTDVGGNDPTLDTGDPGARFFSWRILYDIEAFEDTSMDVTLSPTIRQRFIQLDKQESTQPGDSINIDAPGKPPPPL